MSTLTINEARTKMSGIRRDFDTEVAQIRNSNAYNTSGRRQAIAKALITHREKARALRDNFEIGNEDSRATLTGRLFGVPKGSDASTVLSYRDAQDRVAQLGNPDAASATLKRALEHGDTVLARAVAGHSHGKGWRAVVTDYAERTSQTGDLEALNDLPSGGLAKTAINTLFLVRTPKEIATLRGDCPDGELHAIADGEA